MKGLVFTTFYAYCEQKYGPDLLDEVIEAADLPGGGAFTSVGTYPFEQMVALVTSLVKIAGLTVPQLLDDFGTFCFSQWVTYWPSYFEGRSLFDILASIDDFHEREVRKLYPDAELPSFKVESRDNDRLVLRYYSCKPLADLAMGVMRGASDHLNEKVDISHSAVLASEGNYVRFQLVRVR